MLPLLLFFFSTATLARVSHSTPVRSGLHSAQGWISEVNFDESKYRPAPYCVVEVLRVNLEPTPAVDDNRWERIGLGGDEFLGRWKAFVENKLVHRASDDTNQPQGLHTSAGTCADKTCVMLRCWSWSSQRT